MPIESYGAGFLFETVFQLYFILSRPNKMAKAGAEEIFDQLWTLPAAGVAGVAYTFNACTRYGFT